MPTVSVVMPVYNGERYLAAAVESILDQSHREFEFIIVDDGSTDRTPAILDEYAHLDSRIRVHHQPNSGVVAALNTGISLSSADWIARMDADDIALPQRLETQLRGVAQRPGCVVLGSRVLLIDPDGRPIMPFSIITSHAEIDATHLAGGGCVICHPSVLLHREAVLSVGGYRQEMNTAEDIDLFLRLAEIGRVENLPDCLLHYRLHPNSIGHARRSEQVEKSRSAVEQAHARRHLPYAPASAVSAHDEGGAEESHRRWSWWAIQAGNISTARHHAWQALKINPYTSDNWRVLYCALRGH